MTDSTLKDAGTAPAPPQEAAPPPAPIARAEGTPPHVERDPPGSPARVLFAGQAYYNTWYLSRELRRLGWKADVLNWDTSPENQHLYHGEDFTLDSDAEGFRATLKHLRFYLDAIRNYDVIHFSNMYGYKFSYLLHDFFQRYFREWDEIRLLKRLGKTVVYSANGCLDGVAKSSFASWGDRPVCEDCAWKNVPGVCNDRDNLKWGKLRNEIADYQVLMGGNQIDYNADPHCHHVPEFYCLDTEFWRPDLLVPVNHRLPLPEETVKIYHGVGNFDSRSASGSFRNIKSSHIYIPLIEQLKQEGYPVELVFAKDVPNKAVRYYQLQSDIVCDMLTFGYFGANVREALMLGKPVVCYMRDEWLERMREEIPGFVDEMPIVSATPETVRETLIDLIDHPEKRAEIGRRSREFAVRWFGAPAAAKHFDAVYRNLLAGNPGTSSFR